jgi:hypothetical protein
MINLKRAVESLKIPFTLHPSPFNRLRANGSLRLNQAGESVVDPS